MNRVYRTRSVEEQVVMAGEGAQRYNSHYANGDDIV